ADDAKDPGLATAPGSSPEAVRGRKTRECLGCSSTRRACAGFQKTEPELAVKWCFGRPARWRTYPGRRASAWRGPRQAGAVSIGVSVCCEGPVSAAGVTGLPCSAGAPTLLSGTFCDGGVGNSTIATLSQNAVRIRNMTTLPFVPHGVFTAVFSSGTLAEPIEGEVRRIVAILSMFDSKSRQIFLKFE